MHAFGHRRKNTPHLDQLATQSLVFKRAYAQTAGTSVALASMLTGMTPGSIKWTRGEGGTRRTQLAQGETTIAEAFAKAGYRTAGFLSRGMLKLIPRTMQGFEDLRSLRSKKSSTNRVIDLLHADPAFGRDEQSRPFFVFGYYHGAHAPYRGTKRYGKRPLDRYDSAIARTDAELGELIEHLQRHPRVWENTILIIHSDHGEEFGEHGEKSHNNSCHIESARVPLLMRVPGLKGRSVTGQVANVDIVPTLLELTGISMPSKKLDGQSLLVPALSKHRQKARPLFCYQAHRTGDGLMHGTVRLGRWYLDVHLQRGAAKLFDTRSDPAERQDVYAAHRKDPQVMLMRRLLEADNTGNLTQHTRPKAR